MKKIKYGLLCFVPTLVLIPFWDILPNKIATHFNFHGNADIFSGKWYLILLVPFLGFMGQIIYMTILDRKPDWIGKSGLKKYSFLYVPFLTWFVVLFMLWNS